MTKSEIFEEVRTLLREPQTDTISDPWTYSDDDLVLQIRSALRHLKAKGVSTTTTVSVEGVMDTEPSDAVGTLIALRVASVLLRGDMIRKLNSGELGMYFKAGPDIVDTKTVATNFKKIASEYEDEFEIMLVLALSETSIGEVFGGPTLSQQQ